MYTFKTNRDGRKLNSQYKVWIVLNKRLSAIVDGAVWEKRTKRASWNKVG